MSAVITLLFETDSLESAQMRWPLRLSAGWGDQITVIVPAVGHLKKIVNIDLCEGDSSGLVASLRRALDQEFSPQGWEAAQPGSSGDRHASHDEQDGNEDARIRVALQIVPVENLVARVLALADDADHDLLVGVLDQVPPEGSQWDPIMRALLHDSSCQAEIVLFGQREDDGELLYPTSRGVHSRLAAQLAEQLAAQHSRRLTGLWVEPEIGPDSQRVGRRLLDQMLHNAIPDSADDISRRVEIDNRPSRGILRACADERYEAVIVGMSKSGSLGSARNSTVYQVARNNRDCTLIAVRAPVPLRARAHRFFDNHVRRIVPQLGREERTDIVTRVQANSQWNFDFIAMMGLSTIIAAFGLISDSTAIIIGAMLIAPLMTPLIGLGLAITQRNPQLTKMTSKTAFLGFLFAFLLAFGLGLVDREFQSATHQMMIRSWPSPLDLVIAFVAGLAAAYASSRPGLFAALPGVAIAAALLPPVSVSGLALSIGNFDLAAGSLLLFAVNIVAIVLASTAALWATGLRVAQRRSLTTRIVGAVLVLVAVSMTIGVAVTPSRTAPTHALVLEVESALEDGQRLRLLRLLHEADGPLVQIDLGGSLAPDQAVADRLMQIAKEHMGQKAGIRLTFRYEIVRR